MKIAIVSAMDKEMELILPMLSDKSEESILGTRVVKGKLGKNEIAVAKCGIGKVNSAINTYKIITALSPDLLINSGVAGGASYNTKIGDVLVADYVAYHDVWCGPGTQPGVADGMDVFMTCNPEIVNMSHDIMDGHRLQIGLICSGDRFISEKEEVLEIRRLFPEVLAVDMESAAIAQVCTMSGVPFNIIRVISDTPGSGENIEQYKNFWKEAPEKTFHLVEAILKRI